MLNCKKCQIPISPGRLFCSKSCAASFNNCRKKPRTDESKAKTADTLSRRMMLGEIKKPPISKPKEKLLYTKLYGLHNCNHCHKQFWKLRYDQKCCSTECRDHICSQNKCRKVQIQYFNTYENKQVILQSSWEVDIAVWLDQHKIIWSRPTKRILWTDEIKKKQRTYLPDFYLIEYNHYLDVKNPIKQKEDQYKLSRLQAIIPLQVGDRTNIKNFVARLAGFEPTCIH